MYPFKKVVFPIDYTETCRASIPYVNEMLDHFSAQLTAVRAYGNSNWLPEVEKQERRQLREFVAQAFPSRQVDTFLEEGKPASAIEKVVREQEADLLMIPTDGFNPAGASLFESVAAKVLHDLSTAIWTSTGPVLKGHAHEVGYKKILCAVEFSDETEAVLRAAAAMASSYHASLSLVHVVESFEPGEAATADDRLRGWKQKLAIDAPHKALTGKTTDVLRREASEQNVDLIVAGRGMSQGTLTRLFSDLYTIVRDSPCPVLSV